MTVSRDEIRTIARTVARVGLQRDRMSVLDEIPEDHWAAIAAGTSTYDAAADIQRAIDSDAAVIYFPEGHYHLGDWLEPKSRQFLYGDGPGRTILDRSLNGTGGGVFRLAPESAQSTGWTMGIGTFFRFNAAAAGATTITATTAADAGALTAGEWIYLRANRNDGDLGVAGEGREPKNFEYAVVKTASASTGVITLWWPLVRSYTTADAGYEPEVMRAEASGVPMHVTIRDMTLQGGSNGRIIGGAIHLLVDHVDFRRGGSGSPSGTICQLGESFNVRFRDITTEPGLEGGFGWGKGVHHARISDTMLLGTENSPCSIEEEAYHITIDHVTALGVTGVNALLRLTANPQDILLWANWLHGSGNDGILLDGRRIFAAANFVQHVPGMGIGPGVAVEDATFFGNHVRSAGGGAIGNGLNLSGAGIIAIGNHVGESGTRTSLDRYKIGSGSTEVIAMGNLAQRAYHDESTTSEWNPATILQFYADNLSANTEDAALNLAGRTTGYLMPRAGSIIGVAVALSAARTAGSALFKVEKSSDGGSTWAELAVEIRTTIDATNPQFSRRRFSRHSEITPNAVSAGDLLRVTSLRDAAWLPITADAQIALEVESGLPRP